MILGRYNFSSQSAALETVYLQPKCLANEALTKLGGHQNVVHVEINPNVDVVWFGGEDGL
jgi:hypothetical protein